MPQSRKMRKYKVGDIIKETPRGLIKWWEYHYLVRDVRYDPSIYQNTYELLCLETGYIFNLSANSTDEDENFTST